MTLKIAMIAGEASGDMIAAAFIQRLRQLTNDDIEFVGIGGKMMINAGLNSLHKMETLSVMGYLEVVKSLPAILKIRRQIIKQLIAYQPDVFIGIDAPDFNFYIENKLKQHGIKTVHYVSPSIWAWRYERIFKIKKSTDLMLCIFPMEEAIYAKENIKAKFVGNTLADQIEFNIDTVAYRKQLQIEQYSPVFTILVGSRVAEIKNLSCVFIQTCNLISQEIPNSLFIFPFVGNKTPEIFRGTIANSEVNFQYKILIDQTRDAIKASDMVLAKSGTVSLETALCKKPMLISYKIAKFTEWILKRKIKIKYVGQPNILAGREIVKELLQDDANPENLAKHFVALYNDKTQQQAMIAEFDKLHHELKRDSALEAATAVLELINAK